MDNIPDLSDYGYKITQEMGRNREGGRITWKGTDLTNDETIIIKQFCFATTASTWLGYKAYRQEIELLKQLEHPGIPRYLNSIETNDGFCLIQEYIDAPNLNDAAQFDLFEIEQIILELLEILIYLQQQNPPILHCDLKPENILVDDNIKVYLIDFGLARMGDKELSASSISKGTPGFMAPEQFIQPTLASDLYSLGVTIVCLLTQKKSSQILELITVDDPYQLNFKELLPQLNPQFLRWLNKMLHPQVSNRFANAEEAKKALESIDIYPQTITAANIAKLGTPLTINTTAILFLSTITVLSYKFVASHLELTTVNLAIAIIATIVFTVTELAAGTIAAHNRQETQVAIALAVIIPTLLVGMSGFIFGRETAVAIAASIPLGEIICLSYFGWYKSLQLESQSKINIIYWLCAIVLGFTLGYNFILII